MADEPVTHREIRIREKRVGPSRQHHGRDRHAGKFPVVGSLIGVADQILTGGGERGTKVHGRMALHAMLNRRRLAAWDSAWAALCERHARPK